MKILQRDYTALIILFVLSYFPLFLHLQTSPMIAWDESRLAVSAFEMISNHKYLVITYDNIPDLWSVKPPLMIWVIALSFKLLGYNELALRLPSALFGLLTILLVYQFCKNFLKSKSLGFFSAFVLMTTKGYVEYHVTRTGDYDALLVLLQTGSFLYFIKHYFEDSKNKYNLYLCASFLGLALLTKGVAGLLLCPPILFFIVSERKITTYLSQSSTYIALLIAVLPLSFYIFVREKAAVGYIKAIWEMEFLNRYIAGDGDMNTANASLYDKFLYYIEPIYNVDFLPWIYFLPVGILSIFSYQNNVHRKALLLILSNIFIFIIVISLSSTKKEWYDAPAYPFLAIIVGSAINWLFLQMTTIYQENIDFSLKIGLFLTVFLFFGFPYLQIVEKFHVNNDVRFGWEDRQYRPFMNKVDTSLNFTVFHIGMSGPVVFTEKVFNQNTKRVQTLMLRHAQNDFATRIKEGDKVMICEQEARDSLDKHFLYKTLNTYGTCQLVDITTRK